VRPDIAVPVSLGILVGAWLGARALVRLPETLIRRVFVLVLLVVSAQMIRKGLA
jgi:uncharacterized membrane protein YfcA